MKRTRPFSLESLENRQLLTAFSSHQVSADEEDPDDLEWAVNGSYGTNNDSATDAVFAIKGGSW